MRRYQKADRGYIYKSLKSENLRDDQMSFEQDNTFLNDTGFFSYRMEHGYPYITHFYIDKDKRNHLTALKLLKDFKEKIKEEGYTAFIVEVLEEKQYLSRLVMWLNRRRKPYAEVDGNKYYLVGVES